MSLGNFKFRLILFISIVAILLAADIVVKEVAFHNLAGQPDVVVIPGFWSFRYTANYDIGFGFLRFLDSFLDVTAKRVIIIVLQLVGVSFMVFFYFSPKDFLPSWIKRLPLALITAGGLGNAVYRIIRGFVVDYVLWYFQEPEKFSWPIFNLADTYTVVGAFTLAAFLLFTKKIKKELTPPAAVSPSPDEDEKKL